MPANPYLTRLCGPTAPEPQNRTITGLSIYRVGFLQGAAAGNVDFRAMIRPEGGPNVWIVTENKDYGTPIKTIDIPLDDWVGKTADFILRVEANGSSAQDWAVWLEAKIIR